MVEFYFHVAVGGIDVPENSEGTNYCHPWRIKGNQYHSMLVQPISIWIGHSHHYGDSAPWIPCTTAPPLASVDDVRVSISDDGALDVGGITGSHFRFRHAETGTKLPTEERVQPRPLLFLTAI